jgi:hypothetical protein
MPYSLSLLFTPSFFEEHCVLAANFTQNFPLWNVLNFLASFFVDYPLQTLVRSLDSIPAGGNNFILGLLYQRCSEARTR